MLLRLIVLLILFPLGCIAVCKLAEALGLIDTGEAWAEEKRREKRWKALQKELEEQEEREEQNNIDDSRV